jgi:hypothetical protein
MSYQTCSAFALDCNTLTLCSDAFLGYAEDLEMVAFPDPLSSGHVEDL